MKKLLLILFLSVFIIGCGNNYNPNDVFDQCGVSSNDVEISCKTKQTTPKGATVSSENGIDSSYLPLVDKGLDRAFTNARASGYQLKLDYGFYEVFIPNNPCQLSPVQKIPSFKVKDYSLNYDGSVYDLINTKGEETDPVRISKGYVWKADGKSEILAAEKVLNIATPTSSFPYRASMIVCKEILEEGTNNGAEHVLIANNPDPNRPDDPYHYYYETETHITGGHPLLPQR